MLHKVCNSFGNLLNEMFSGTNPMNQETIKPFSETS